MDNVGDSEFWIATTMVGLPMILAYSGPSRLSKSQNPTSLAPFGTVALPPVPLSPGMHKAWEVRMMGLQGMGQTDWGSLFAGAGGASVIWMVGGGLILIYILFAGTKARQRRSAIKTETTRHETTMGEIKKKYKRI